jgi:hypothetical protein
VLPASKANVGVKGERTCTHLLPIQVAKDKLQRWIPWALERIRRDLDDIIVQFDRLGFEELAEIEAEGVEDHPEIEEEHPEIEAGVEKLAEIDAKGVERTDNNV